jgi:glutathione reductase (NADPH)
VAEPFDLFVIGGGSGGVACARRAALHGARVAVAEASRVGGTCVIRGCVPKKLMHYAARFAEQIDAAAGYGWRVSGAEHDWDELIAARNKEIDRLNGVYLKMLERSGVTLFPSRARIEGADGDGFMIEVDGRAHHARRVLVAVGARPQLVGIPGIEHAITSDQVLEGRLPRPRSVAVVGAGYIGLEVASILVGLGIDTTMLFRADLPLRHFDLDLRIALTDAIAKRGVRLRPGVVVRAIVARPGGVTLDTSEGPLEVDRVVYATGRKPRPNTAHLGLDSLGVELDETGAVQVDPAYESSLGDLFAIGDCSDHAGQGLDSGSHDLTPVAIAEGRALAERLFNSNPVEVAYDTIPTAVFSLPEAAMVGLSEERARKAGFDVAIYRTRFRPMLHTLTGHDVQTMMKLVVDKASDRVLGCHMVGDDAAEIIQGLAVALTAGATKAQFDATVALHPSAAEEFVTMSQPVG